MERKRDNLSWCCDQIKEKINDYKISLSETENEEVEEVQRQLEIVIEDLETISETKDELSKINYALVKFDSFISSVTRTPTDEHIRIYEHWLDCRRDIQKIVVAEQQKKEIETIRERNITVKLSDADCERLVSCPPGPGVFLHICY